MNEIYKVIISTSAQREIRKLQKIDLQKILPAIASLSQEPRPLGCKKLVGTSNSYRIRTGNYRVLYLVSDMIRIVEVSGVKHRKEAYE